MNRCTMAMIRTACFMSVTLAPFVALGATRAAAGDADSVAVLQRDEQMAQAVEDWQRLALKLSNAGYLVLDSTAVIAAPDDVYVRTEGC